MAEYDFFSDRKQRRKWVGDPFDAYDLDKQIACHEAESEAIIEVMEDNLDRRIGRFEQ